MSEDCLYLNVYTPTVKRMEDAGKLLPVMIWIHGGNNVVGSGSTPIYRPDEVVNSYDVIVVTVNYRLGIFGFFASEELKEEAKVKGTSYGNYGLLDQLAAIHWIHKNISSFGGDPDCMTLYGESAGAVSIHYLCLFADNLPIRRAIMMSGTVFSGLAYDAISPYAAVESHILTSTDSSTLEDLRAVDGEVLHARTEAFLKTGKPISWRPVVNKHIDGALIPIPPAEAVRLGMWKSGVDAVVFGDSDDEGNFFAHNILGQTGGYSQDRLAKVISGAFGSGADQIREVYARYLADESPDGVKIAMARIFGESTFQVGTRIALDAATKVRSGAVRVYGRGVGMVLRYRFSGTLDVLKHLDLGACHTVINAFTFLHVAQLTPSERALANRLMLSLTTFAANGAPPSQWRAYDAKLPELFNFVEGKDGVMLGRDEVRGYDAKSAEFWTQKLSESRKEIAAVKWLIDRLDAKNLTPYQGFTSDGVVRPNVYDLSNLDEGAPSVQSGEKVVALLSALTPENREAVYAGNVAGDAFRLWSNPELYINPGGLRMDEQPVEVQNAVHDVLRASLSPQGYEKTWACCLTNGFLGHLVNGRAVLNEHSYNFRLFGVSSDPSSYGDDRNKPWGYTFFGHHLCLAVIFVGRQMVIGPCFMGAEPDVIDEGPHKGLRLFEFQEIAPLKLMQSLSPELQEKATLFKSMDGKDLPPGRWNPFDERHLGGAREDNRIVPYEGLRVTEMPVDKQEIIVEIFKSFNEYYPASVLEYRVKDFRRHLGETFFAWIGPHKDNDPYYYRIHSPVSFLELDFHCGIFLTNTSPARCHIHTTARLPNRGDYGKVLLESAGHKPVLSAQL
ncbi:hypothetical protein HDU93_001668 [Gonapodya sp. JEL0774]|nr:hypothetical protein HDU93_001668 [Gonapodya sp. JEL0774]